MNMRTYRSQKQKIEISSRIGTLLASFDDDGQVLRVRPAGSTFTERAVSYDGKSYHVEAVLQLFNGLWVTARTEGGNEAKHGLDARERAGGARPMPDAAKRVKDTFREAILSAVNVYFEAHPELLVEARAVAKSNAVHRAEEVLARAREAVAKAEAALQAALAAEVQS